MDLASAPLPVLWGEIEVSEIIEGTVIYWNTYSEINNSHFIVYKSEDNLDWKVIDTVRAENTRNGTNYSVIDHKKNTNTTYYRIKQVDKNGDFDFSPIASLTLDNHKNISLYPNPVQNELHLLNWNEKSSWEIFDALGKKVLSGNNSIINVKKLSKGLYFLKGSNGSSLRILKN